MVMFFAVAMITLGIMAIYLLNLPDSASPSRFWLTLLVGLWMIVNLFLEIRDLLRRRANS